jgi:hypothetical protein
MSNGLTFRTVINKALQPFNVTSGTDRRAQLSARAPPTHPILQISDRRVYQAIAIVAKVPVRHVPATVFCFEVQTKHVGKECIQCTGYFMTGVRQSASEVPKIGFRSVLASALFIIEFLLRAESQTKRSGDWHPIQFRGTTILINDRWFLLKTIDGFS